MGCLLFKESKLNFLENLKTEEYINSRRELTFEKDVHKYLNDLVNRLNLNYDLNLKALVTIKEVKIKTGKDFSRDSEKFILTPIEESFEQIDNRRKELGIYEDRISIGEYNKTQGEKINKQGEINLNSFNGDKALLEQEEKENLVTDSKQAVNQVVKPGVAELFDSNYEFANAVYKALGFENAIIQIPNKYELDKEYNLKSVLNNLLNTENESINNIYKVLLNSIPSNLKLVYSKNIRQNANGEFIYLEDIIKINPDKLSHKTLIHEIIHALTHDTLLKNEEFNNKITVLRKQAIQYFEENRPKAIQGSTKSALASNDEFLAGLFNYKNLDFLNTLNNIPIENTILLEKIKNVFKDLINEVFNIVGIKLNKNSLLFEVINELGQIETSQITPQQKQQATFMFSEFLDVYLQDYEQVEKILKEENIIEKDCTGGGKLKAEKGLQTNFTKGGEWKLIKDLKGYPTHKEGGVDLTIGKNGVTIKNGNTQFTAKYGLVIPKAQNGLVIPKKDKNDIDHWKNVYSKNKRLPQYVWDYYTPQEQINYFGTTKENNTSNIKGVTVFNNLLKNKTAYGNFLSGDADVAVNNKDYFEISNLYKSGKINRKEYLEKLYSKAVNTSDGSKYTHKGGSNPPIRPLNINSSQDALNIFLGKPQKYNSFSISDYKPSTSNNKNSYYYKLNREEELENELFNTSKNVLTNQDDFINSGENERFVKGSHLGEASLKNFKLSKGEDDRGKYVSYYDINDYGNVLDLAGNPFEIYNRIYYKNYDGQNKKMYYSDKELSELDIDKKDFDILGLQRELSNRGYKLPKSTKQDNSLDGIWGDETKNALLEYRKSQNKTKQ